MINAEPTREQTDDVPRLIENLEAEFAKKRHAVRFPPDFHPLRIEVKWKKLIVLDTTMFLLVLRMDTIFGLNGAPDIPGLTVKRIMYHTSTIVSQ
jgi:hypothetical protein